MKKSILCAPVLFSMLALSNLGHAQSSTAPAAPPISGSKASSQPVAPAAKTLTDPEIIGVLEAANKGEIDEAKRAKKTTKSKPVRDYAEMMISAHGNVLKDLDHVADKNDLKAADNDMKAELEKTAKANVEKLKGVSGKELDRHYINDQVAAHQGLLEKIDTVLLPSATNPDLKAFIAKIRVSVAEHLEKAKGIQTTIGGAH